MGGLDLHTHSTYSDGTTTIGDNVDAAAALGLDGIAITDHDTTAPFAEALAAGAEAGIEIIVGTEFSAEHEGLSVHVLGYWVDPDDEALAAELDRLRNERTNRARLIVAKLNDLGIGITFERVREIAADAPIGRPHIAKAVVELGAVATIDEAFVQLLADGGPAHIPKHAVAPDRAVDLLVAAGGAAVLAHPALYGDRETHGGVPVEVIEQMVHAGLSGIEADHPDHTRAQRSHYRDLAKALDLVVTAGSDYHGDSKQLQLGSATTDRQTVERLRAARKSH